VKLSTDDTSTVYWFRGEYKSDLTAANDANAVLIMDYS
jgi:hypothetical protein